MPNDCPSEASKQSKDSPSTISNGENLLHILVEPHNYEVNGLTKRAFSRSELRKSQVSLSRKSYTTEEILKKEVINPLLKRDSKRKFIGLLQADCGEVRSLKTDDSTRKRAFCVIDDGLPSNIGHAHLGFSEIAKQRPKNQQTAYRANLILVFGSECPIREVYD